MEGERVCLCVLNTQRQRLIKTKVNEVEQSAVKFKYIIYRLRGRLSQP